MKKLFTILTLLFSVCLCAQQEHYQSVFEEANNAFAASDFSLASEKYEELIAKELISDDLFYNAANAYYKNNELANAILYYEKALKINPKNEDATFNLSIAKSQTIDKIETIPTFFLTSFFDSLKNTFSANGWAVNSIALLFIASVCFITYFLSKQISIKKIGFILSIISILFFCISLYFGYQKKNESTNKKMAIVFSPSLTVKSAPDQQSTKLFVVHEGTKILIKETNNDWSRIAIEDGNEGWIPLDSYKEI